MLLKGNKRGRALKGGDFLAHIQDSLIYVRVHVTMCVDYYFFISLCVCVCVCVCVCETRNVSRGIVCAIVCVVVVMWRITAAPVGSVGPGPAVSGHAAPNGGDHSVEVGSGAPLPLVLPQSLLTPTLTPTTPLYLLPFRTSRNKGLSTALRRALIRLDSPFE